MSNFTGTLAANGGFNWIEYSSLIVTLFTSFVIGAYYGLFRGNASAERDLVGEKLSFLPLTASLLASAISGVTFLGHPSESYTHGIAYCIYLVISQVLSGLISAFICIPIVYNLQLNNLYEYFDKRFDRNVRKLTILIFVLTQMTYTAITSYPPAVVINQFSGVKVSYITSGIMAYCTLYTLLGGFKGVVAIDTFQAAVMILTVLIITPFGVHEAGGVSAVWSVARDSGRLTDFTFDMDPTIRMSFWSVAMGNALSVTSHISMNQAMYQRFVSLKSLEQAKWACVVLVLSMNLFSVIMTVIGLAAYATFDGCEPKSAKLVETYTHAIVYWMNYIGARVQGLRGIYIAGIISASMSTISTNINSIAGILFIELVKVKPELAPKLISRTLVVSVGVVAGMIILAIKDGGSIVELFNCFTAAGGGLVVGLFALGMLTTSANARGALYGGLISLGFIATLAIGSRVYILRGLVPGYPVKTMRTDLCPDRLFMVHNQTRANPRTDYVPTIFKISSFYYGPFAALLALMAGLVVSYLTRTDTDERGKSPELFYEPLRKNLSQRTNPGPKEDTLDEMKLLNSPNQDSKIGSVE